MAHKLIWYQKTVDKLEEKLADNIEEVGLFIEQEAKKNITDMGAVKTGNLKNSIAHVTDKKQFTTIIGTDVKYAKNVELGTPSMAPRPFLRYALLNNTTKIKEMLTKGNIQ